MKSKYTRATHLIVDLFGCENLKFTVDQLKDIITSTGCTYLHMVDVMEMTHFIQMKEGYMAININTNYNYVAIDFYDEGDNTSPKLALPLFSRLFKPKEESIRVLKRGYIS